MSKNTKIISSIIIILLAVTIAGAAINRQYAKEREALLEAEEIALMREGAIVSRLSMQEMAELPVEEFTAKLKSSIMNKPETHVYKGVTLYDVLLYAGLDPQDDSELIVRSADGFTASFSGEEIRMPDHIYLVYMENGKYLSSYNDSDGKGPYMIVVRGDQFSQRWAKFVVEMDIIDGSSN